MKHGEQAPEVTFEHSDATDFEVMEHCFPWMLAGADALVEALLSELVSGVGTDSGKKGGTGAISCTVLICSKRFSIIG